MVERLVAAWWRRDGGRALPTLALVVVMLVLAPAAGAAEAPTSMRAFGDSFTSGFGYYGDGEDMSSLRAPACRPEIVLSDACSSNSNNRNATDPIAFSADTGLANGVAWTAQFAKHFGLDTERYRNLAVTGSSALDWADGQITNIFDQVIDADPELIAVTLGGNPTLSDILFGDGEVCRLESGPAFRACVQAFVDLAETPERLVQVYVRLLRETRSIVAVLRYPLVIPAINRYTVEQLRMAGQIMNENVETAADRAREIVGPEDARRLEVLFEPRFNVGLAPGTYDCSGIFFTSIVDGPSHQSSLTQTLEQGLHPTLFCTGEAWVLSADTGIHPNRVGHKEMAKALIGFWDRHETALHTADLAHVTGPQDVRVGRTTRDGVRIEVLRCPRVARRCHGTLSLGIARRVRGERRARQVQLASRAYSVAGGTTIRPRLAVTAAARRLLLAGGRAQVRHHRVHPDGRRPLEIEALRVVRQTGGRRVPGGRFTG